MPTSPELSLAEWAVLALLDEGRTHGFAIASVTAPDGAVGRIWHVPRPVVYRAVARITALDLAHAVGDEPGLGPRRQILAATPHGRAAVARWIVEPARHVRDVRSELLVKLALHDRRGSDPRSLLEAQRAVLETILAALASEEEASSGIDLTVAFWRRSSAAAALEFVTAACGALPSGK